MFYHSNRKVTSTQLKRDKVTQTNGWNNNLHSVFEGIKLNSKSNRNGRKYTNSWEVNNTLLGHGRNQKKKLKSIGHNEDNSKKTIYSSKEPTLLPLK